MVSFTDSQLLAWLSSFLLPFFRVLALMSSAPLLSNRAFPVRARVGTSALVAIVAAPFVTVPAGVDLGSADSLLLAGREVLIGLAIGFVAQLVFAAFELAGETIGLQMGLSYAGYFDPQSGNSNAIGRTVVTLALLTFVALDGPLLLLAAVIRSFEVFPVALGTALPWDRVAPVQLGAQVFSLGLTVALPFMALLLFVNLVLGVMSRVAPQLNVIAVGFPVTIVAGLVLLAIGLPVIEQPLASATERVLAILAP